MLSESGREVGGLAVANTFGDLRYRQLRGPQQPQGGLHTQLRLVFVDGDAELLLEPEVQLVAIHLGFRAEAGKRQGGRRVRRDLLADSSQFDPLGGGQSDGGSRFGLRALPILEEHSQQVEGERPHSQIVPGLRQPDIEATAGLGER